MKVKVKYLCLFKFYVAHTLSKRVVCIRLNAFLLFEFFSNIKCKLRLIKERDLCLLDTKYLQIRRIKTHIWICLIWQNLPDWLAWKKPIVFAIPPSVLWDCTNKGVKQSRVQMFLTGWSLIKGNCKKHTCSCLYTSQQHPVAAFHADFYRPQTKRVVPCDHYPWCIGPLHTGTPSSWLWLPTLYRDP